MQKITENVYVETGVRGCNHGIVITSEGVVMIDTPMVPSDAMRWRDEIAQFGPVRYIVNTEPHIDHFSGNSFFKGTIVGHEGTRAAILVASVEQLKGMLKRTAPESLSLLEGFSFRPPTITLSEQLTLYLGKHTFKLTNMPGHTPFQVMVYIPEERVVFTSDNVVREMPFLHQALPYQWLDSLKKIEELEADVLVPGHGSVCDRSYLPEMRAIIQAWIDAVTTAINKGMSLEETQDKISMLDRFPGASQDEFKLQVQRMNVAHLYEVLKSKGHSTD
jgi:glyoxylase-like metal-dependent hydrolase (beta-lactamase superfamily II)